MRKTRIIEGSTKRGYVATRTYIDIGCWVGYGLYPYPLLIRFKKGTH